MDLPEKLPTHISFIMDGNGRWAKERGLDRVQGHMTGVESVRAVIEACAECKIPYLSLFAFSEENWNRPDAEVSALMKLMAKSIAEEFEKIMKNGIRIVVIGNRSRLAPELEASLRDVEEKSKDNPNLTVIVFLSCSGKWDLQQAADRMAAEGGHDLSAYLATAGFPDPDVIVRTSGEKRISNFLLWQAAYSEFVFTDVLWPDFRKDSFRDVLFEYASRDRRYGKVK